MKQEVRPVRWDLQKQIRLVEGMDSQNLVIFLREHYSLNGFE